MSNDQEIEQLIVSKGKTAPRVTPFDVQQCIEEEIYLRPTGTLTICVLVLTNGFTVTGESACASPENYDEEIGNKIARGNAEQKIWGLLGFHLKQKLHEDLGDA